MKVRRLFPYLILNIIVSAATILTILYLWDRSRNIDLPVLTPMPVASTPTPEPTPTLPPLDKPVILIKNVFGTGDLQNEVVLLNRQGDGQLELTGWQLKDGNGHSFTFPKLILNQDGAVQVFSRAGADSVIELHWGLDQPLWKSGMTVSLLDPLGNLRASYHIP
jgi:hypothetical protein